MASSQDHITRFFSETDFIVKLDRYNHSVQGVKTCNTKCTFKCCFHIN